MDAAELGWQLADRAVAFLGQGDKLLLVVSVVPGRLASEQIFPRPLRQRRLIHRPERSPLVGCIRLLRRRRVGRMPPMITRHNPTQLHNPPGYHHVTVVEAGRLAFLAGQCPLDAFGALVGAGDIDLQIDQVAANAAAVLAAVGARPDQVVRSVVYVVSDDNSVLAAAWRRLTLSVIGSAFTTASTLLGVTRLGFSGQLVEVDLTAAL